MSVACFSPATETRQSPTLFIPLESVISTALWAMPTEAVPQCKLSPQKPFHKGPGVIGNYHISCCNPQFWIQHEYRASWDHFRHYWRYCTANLSATSHRVAVQWSKDIMFFTCIWRVLRRSVHQTVFDQLITIHIYELSESHVLSGDAST